MASRCPSCGSKKFDVVGEGYLCRNCGEFFAAPAFTSRFQVLRSRISGRRSGGYVRRRFRRPAQKAPQGGGESAQDQGLGYVRRRFIGRGSAQPPTGREDYYTRGYGEERGKQRAIRREERRRSSLEWIFILIIVIYLGYVGFKIFGNEDIQELVEKGKISTRETPYFKSTTGVLGKIKEGILNPDKFVLEIGDWGTPESKNVEIKKVFITIDKFESRRENYREDIPIVLDGKISVSDINKELKLDLGCNLNVNNKIIEGKVDVLNNPYNIISVDENTGTRSYSLRCEFEPEQVDISSDVVTEASLVVEFSNVVNSWLSVYTISLDGLAKQEDPFEGISDPNVDRLTRKVKSFYDGGPVNLGMRLEVEQPVTGDETYPLSIGLTNDRESWNGDFNLTNLNIFTPQGFDVVHEPELCFDFEGTLLKQEIMEKINKDEKDNFEIDCEIGVESVTSDNIEAKTLKISADYDYFIERKAPVSIKVAKENLT